MQRNEWRSHAPGISEMTSLSWACSFSGSPSRKCSANPIFRLLNRENLEDFQDDLYSSERTTRKEIEAHRANRPWITFQIIGLSVESFKGGGRSPAVLFSMAAQEGEVSFSDAKLEAMEQPEKWLKKDAGPGYDTALTEQILMPLLGAAIPETGSAEYHQGHQAEFL